MPDFLLSAKRTRELHPAPTQPQRLNYWPCPVCLAVPSHRWSKASGGGVGV